MVRALRQLGQFPATLILAAALLASSLIDIRTRRLPDWLTLPLLVLGLALALLREPPGLHSHVLAAVLGFLAFYLIAALYRRYRGQHGLGLGDAKLLAAAGAWLGPVYLAPVVFFGAILALGFVVILRVLGRTVSWQMTLPFGPFLSAGVFVCWCLRLMGWPIGS